MGVFLLCVLALTAGYAFYGLFVERLFGSDSSRIPPAVRCEDDVDYIPLPTWRVFLIQFLNIAGLGPVFGAILGALYGPVALLWIVFGSIFAGAVHDYLSGMISVRNDGQSLSFLVEKYLGRHAKTAFLIFLIFFLLLLGTIFAVSPAQMLAEITETPLKWWLIAVFSYYFLATLLPIDKIIGRIYPLFAVLLLGVSIALLAVLFTRGEPFYPHLNLDNQHPSGLPVFPLMFVTIACGAVSGFHASQSPLMARCLSNEKYGRPVFYGAMITEGIVALIWATLGMSFYQDSAHMQAVISAGSPGSVVSQISKAFLGETGGIFAILSVIILSVTSGDTAFRSARLSLADFFKMPQKDWKRRLTLSVLLLGSGVFLSRFDLTRIWTYFGWSNQVVATITLWVCTVYLARHGKNFWISLIPALFMTTVCTTYIAYEKIGFGLPLNVSEAAGIAFAAFLFGFFIYRKKKAD